MKKLLLIAMLFSLMACEKNDIDTKTVKFIDKSGIDFIYCEFTVENKTIAYSDDQLNLGIDIKNIVNSFRFRFIDSSNKVYQSIIDITTDCTIEFYCDNNVMRFKYFYN